MWKVAIKKPLAGLCLAIGVWHSPFKLDLNDQVCPEIQDTQGVPSLVAVKRLGILDPRIWISGSANWQLLQ